MPDVVLNHEIARRYTNGESRLTVEGDTIRALINALDAQYPGIGAVLRTDMAVAIDSLGRITTTAQTKGRRLWTAP